MVGIGILVELARQIGFAFVEVRREEKAAKAAKPDASTQPIRDASGTEVFFAPHHACGSTRRTIRAGDVWSGCMDAYNQRFQRKNASWASVVPTISPIETVSVQ